jgi:lantibiotic modifying enzyme
VPRRRRPGEVLAYGLAWCHGAPGIALSRLRAAHLLDDPTYRAEAQTGLDTTRKSLAHALAAGSGNFSLCHGLAGNADILLYGSGGDESGVALARQIAATGIARHGTGAIPWPCGVPHGGELPGLMLGLAGIGLWYLRLHNPAIPSVLIIHP